MGVYLAERQRYFHVVRSRQLPRVSTGSISILQGYLLFVAVGVRHSSLLPWPTTKSISVHSPTKTQHHRRRPGLIYPPGDFSQTSQGSDLSEYTGWGYEKIKSGHTQRCLQQWLKDRGGSTKRNSLTLYLCATNVPGQSQAAGGEGHVPTSWIRLLL